MSDTGWVSPGTVVNDSSSGTDAWSNPGNALSADGSYARVGSMSSTYSYTQLIKGTNFSFSVPAGSTINGISVQIKRYNDYQYAYDEGVYIVKADGSIGTSNKALATVWGWTNAYFDYGDSTDLWGETWTASDINDTDFGVALYVRYNDSSNGSIGNNVLVDHIQIKVYYSVGSERSLYIEGYSTDNSERGLYTEGFDTGDSERNLYLGGIDANSSERGLYIYGILDGTALYKNLTIKKDNSAIRNRVYVRGGTYLSDEVSIKQVADGEQTVFNLPEKPHEMSILEGVTSKTVGIKNVDSFDDFDYLMSYQEKYVETETAPTVDTVLTFAFKYDIPVLVAVENKESIEKYGQLEYIIFDKNIDTIAQARERASAELTDYAESIIEGSFETETTGFKAGQSLTVTLSDLDIDETFIVKSVNAKSIGGGNFIYKINIVSAEMLGIIGFLVGLLEDDKNSLNISSDETVDEIKTITTETFGITDGTPTVDLNTDPFKYDSNAEWDIAEWEAT